MPGIEALRLQGTNCSPILAQQKAIVSERSQWQQQITKYEAFAQAEVGHYRDESQYTFRRTTWTCYSICHAFCDSVQAVPTPLSPHRKMWLLEANTKTLTPFLGIAPPYAILSHTWQEEEVTFQDVIAGQGTRKKGWKKIELCCRQAVEDGLAFVWIDTCCIDKNSSAELSEAINSMFAWYRHARCCYAYLEDVYDALESGEYGEQPFARSRWFTRGWTLQELIAPKAVHFFDSEWTNIGSRDVLAKQISQITDIDLDLLQHQRELYSYSIAQRFSWAAKRKTTRLEDQAYSLLGIFHVNMPLLYGEGSKALRRLQEQILQSTSDLSILAWDDTGYAPNEVLAAEVEDFGGCQDIVLGGSDDITAMFQRRITANNGIYSLTTRVLNTMNDAGTENKLVALLDCRHAADITTVIGLCLTPLSMSPEEAIHTSGTIHCRVGWGDFSKYQRIVSVDLIQAATSQSVEARKIVVNANFSRELAVRSGSRDWTHIWVRFADPQQSSDWSTVSAWPEQYWNTTSRTFDVRKARSEKTLEPVAGTKQSRWGLPVAGSIVLTHRTSKSVKIWVRQVSDSSENGIQYAMQFHSEAAGELSIDWNDVRLDSRPCSLQWSNDTVLKVELDLVRTTGLRIAHLAVSLKSNIDSIGPVFDPDAERSELSPCSVQGVNDKG